MVARNSILESYSIPRSLRKGFSLIKLVVLITIIGVLATTAFREFRLLQEEKESITRIKLVALDAALEQYNTTMGEYPIELRELVEGPQKSQLREQWGKALATEGDLKDAWGNKFVYTREAEGARRSYELLSTGSTGEVRTFLVIIVFVMIGLLSFVIPQITSISEGQNSPLPLATRMLMGVSDFLRNHYILLFIITAGIVGASIVWSSTARGAYTIDKFKLPVIEYFSRTGALVQFCSTLGMLISGGLTWQRPFLLWLK